MPVYADHPLRRARLRKGLASAELARKAGVNRSTVTAIEEGRTRYPDAVTVTKIEPLLGFSPGTLAPAITKWRKQAKHALSNRQRAILDLSPSYVSQYPDFVAWRRDLGFPTPTSLASALHLPTRTVGAYERGQRVKPGLPQTLAMALLDCFDLPDAYLEQLSELPPAPGVSR